jgi:hypothetical protein
MRRLPFAYGFGPNTGSKEEYADFDLRADGELKWNRLAKMTETTERIRRPS